MTEFRTINGLGNNLNDPTLGSTHTELIRLTLPAYEDGFNTPRGGFVSTLPNARTISNTVVAQTESIPNTLNASDWLWQWGQFIDHDLDLNEGGSQTFFISVDDPNDPLYNANFPFLPLTRVPAAPGTGTDPSNPRQQDNDITSFIDGSSVYGSDEVRADFLRSFDNGLLKVSVGSNGEILLPYNTAGLANANPFGFPSADLFIAGDARVNEQIGLTAVHNLFVREHNRIATDLLGRLEGGETALVQAFEDFETAALVADPTATAAQITDEWVYQNARFVVSAEIQAITYQEFLPFMVGPQFTAVNGLLGGGFGIETYTGYDDTVDPSVSHEFANAAYRVGHTLLNNQLLRADENGITSTPLGNPDDITQAAFFNIADVEDNGVDSLYSGLTLQQAQDIDNFVVDGVREFLFPAGTGGFDLPAVNIQRGREVGIPGYVEVYNALGLDSVFGDLNSFSDLVSSGLFTAEVVDKIDDVYTDVSQIDLWLGGISENAINGGLLGPTFNLIVSDQFERTRNGDRFFFLDQTQSDYLQILDPNFQNVSLSEVIRANTADDFFIADNAFEVPYDNRITGTGASELLVGTSANDLIEGLGGNDTLNGKDGDDILYGNEGNDILKGKDGNDVLYGGAGNDSLEGDAGKDFLKGGAGNDSLKGGFGDDQLFGGAGDDKLDGNAGKDFLVGGDGNDSLKGGDGDDILRGTGDSLGVGEIDKFEGNGGKDTFILGDVNNVFYVGNGSLDYVAIKDFNKDQDLIQLNNDVQYVLAASGIAGKQSGIFVDTDSSGTLTTGDDLIAAFEKTITNLNQGFTFV
ncbi:peroxidase family protein [Crocosphaera sp. XPORK-15E]|uniref:peroxidase family protein n=1 Tax=Crocosphaera sp. XPORK-15E TaxID=3110247 RepID=UPI002B20EC6D|nr:peroxidase family protein [Crocosphaera sp. XPORK-15E]MEA5536545.1 peroxidase family protein [Crocosphaera sp. XPORK-15E]